MIILEGPDNSGKSTLAHLLSKELSMAVIHPGSAPGNKAEELKMILSQLSLMDAPVIHDRVTFISNMVYNIFRGENTGTNYGRYCREIRPPSKIIFCRPEYSDLLSMDNHVIKDYDTRSHIDMINKNAIQIVTAYDYIMQFIPHIKYDYRNSKIDLILKYIEE